VILIVLDTLRADHLGFYGYERDTSPHLDAFARDSVAFRYAFTAAPWTPPSVVTMLTGLYASTHGHIPPNSRKEAKRAMTRLSGDLVTLPRLLRERGYRTAAVSPNPWISPLFGFDRDFEIFEYLHKQAASEIRAAAVKVLEKLSSARQPFFLYLHFFDPHDPYAPPEPYRTMFPPSLQRATFAYDRKMLPDIRRYDGEIRYLDDELGRLFAFLKEKGLYDEALIVIVGDHGEQFREHGHIHHGNALYNEEVHVPLFVRDHPSGRGPEVVEQVVSTVDIFPTVLAQLGIPPPRNRGPGFSLFARGALRRRVGVLSEVRRITDQRGFIGRDGRKVIFEVPLLPFEEEAQRIELWRRPSLIGLFDLERDYLEQSPLDEGATAARLRDELEAGFYLASLNRTAPESVPAAQMTEEMLDELKSLGYLQ
jgi:arylsulfatase A-like enzyme